MKLNLLKFGTTTLIWLSGTVLVSAQQVKDQSGIQLSDLSAFKDPGKTWSIAENTHASLKIDNELKVTKGVGVLVNIYTNKTPGTDLYTDAVYGNVIIELDYMMAKGANAGIYLQGNYEIQLMDSWGVLSPSSSDNGGVYERWDDSKPEGYKGFGGYAPRQNASKAPGLWQHLKIVFQAPKFDAAGKKTENAKIVSAELNGVMIHENVILFGPTRGASTEEKALGPLRIQGDHGSAAFKNIRITKFEDRMDSGGNEGRGGADPIYIDAPSNTMIRSFVDIGRNQRAVHAISVGSPYKMHYSYDLDHGLLLMGWHGEFVDATPMWVGRGDGSSKARGATTLFTRTLAPAVAQLTTAQTPWPTDSTGTGFRTRGYVMDDEDRPIFKYNIFGSQVTDAVKIADNGKKLNRTITIDQSVPNLYILLARSKAIEEVAKGLYLIDGQSYYLELDEVSDKPLIRDLNGQKELVVLLGSKLNYFISF